MNLSRPLSLLAFTLVVLTCLAPSSVLAQKKGTYRIIGLSADAGEVYAMNAAGVSVGQTRDAAGRDNPHAWAIGADNQVVETDLATGGLDGWANDINNDGIIAGNLAEQVFPGTQRGVVWLDATAEPLLLPLPEGDARVFDSSAAQAVSVRPNADLQAVIVGRIVELVGNGYVFLVPTVPVETHVLDALRPVCTLTQPCLATAAETRSVKALCSHAERGNKDAIPNGDCLHRPSDRRASAPVNTGQ